MFIRASTNRSGSDKRRGVVLLAVLVVVALLTLAAYQYGQMMLSEYKAADAYTRSMQARVMADSGVHYAAALLSNADAVQNTLNSNPWDNATAFEGIVVRESDQPRFKGRFSLIAPLDVDSTTGGVTLTNQGYRFGVTDEAAKLNLSALMRIDSSGKIAYNALMKLPNMTDELANSILDWIDSNTTEARAGGAKSQYYGTLTPPYYCKSGPLDSIEELLLVKGVTPQLLFGNDRNRNGILDADENDGSGAVDRGWSAYLTLYSRELNVDATGAPRIFINDSDLEGLYTKLQDAVGADLAAFIIAYRQYGPASSGSGSGSGGQSGGAQASGGGMAAQPATTQTSRTTGAQATPAATGAGAGATRATGGSGATGGGAAASGGGQSGGGATPRLSRTQLNFQQGSGTAGGAGGTGGGQARSISSLYELINAQVSIPGSGQNAQATIYPSPMSDPSAIRQLFPTLYDKVTTSRDGEMPGRVNVNTASRAVLTTLPGLTDTDVQAILDHRPDPSSTQAPDAIFQTPAWLVTEASLSSNTLRTLDRYITTRTQVYRVQSIGYFDGGGPTARIEAVIDTNAGRPRILYWRDLTELGKGYELSGN